ncbi:MAG: DUF4136 domain-containing protein [Chitinophagales bacterium]|nr:DUF4136 domain-containing protein [Chitinophagales bacterium]MDW8393235.1 DUF4136 domain-containing protein [Chitinophagales bacterium]
MTAALESKGLRPSNDPDLLVDLIVRTKEKQSASATTYDMGGYYGRRYWYGGSVRTTQVHVDNYTEGTLIIDLVDARKKELIWEGRGTAEVTSSTVSEERVTDAVNRILSEFPPTKKK